MEEDFADLPVQRFGLIYVSRRLMDMLVRGGGELGEKRTRGSRGSLRIHCWDGCIAPLMPA